ncbi:membrane bound O-acyl transferase, MBOAT family protein [Magnetococcus marinus MC-1]|uniref:Probable alginate O-acetylase AlgI n=1 Tax=Magnetococcus marinus (strain ATCC BAA-1437 / JCM 17883 / MC-1) TaxID=156889 RepID=A0L4M3_MAGMM|nr:MBOAT family protein [Magnetococcus marinus]ABK42916.1 membrane bound O-acyl transferase, MBOAT family protein [Magnetococcus marinus MC-1]
MLFNSYTFLLYFLPTVWAVTMLLRRYATEQLTLPWLVAASLFFYGWWNPRYLLLILLSMGINYALAGMILQRRGSVALLTVGILVNLGLLGWFKYALFVGHTLNQLLHSSWSLPQIVLPLAISFFTFQQIAYLVDCHRQQVDVHNPLHYMLFVTFFPQLIAGPIVHHKEMMGQFRGAEALRPSATDLYVGLTIFIIGLGKKVLIADTLAPHADVIFNQAEAGGALSLVEAWLGVLAYTGQIYFDFSGYSDMAIGLGRLFGIHLPLNFNSPYKAHSIIEFWRRWHMTLSRFLRDYLYIPLGGGHCAPWRRYTNLMLTMLLGGLWHGAGWTFMVWGLLHGTYLMINHAWQHVGTKRFTLHPWFAVGLTFMAVVVGWVFFRATSFAGASHLLAAMFGLHGVTLPATLAPWLPHWSWLNYTGIAPHGLLNHTTAIAQVGMALLAAWVLPNTYQMMRQHVAPELANQLSHSQASFQGLLWRPTARWGIYTGLILAGVLLSLQQVSAFLYFQF